ncbi:MAG: metallopeptidase TldD-related protein [Actinomycetota bacterium]
MTPAKAQADFDELVSWATASLHGDEVLLASLRGETSDFVRFNHAAVRQAGTVEQKVLSVDVIDGARHAEGSVSLTGDRATDQARLAALIDELRSQRAVLPEDPFLLYATDGGDSARVVAGTLPAAAAVVDAVVDGARGNDFVGIYAAGSTYEAFGSSLGQRNWFEATTFNLDWSLHLGGDKATKNGYAGTTWSADAFASKLDWSIRELDALARPPKTLPPGGYRSYLSPAAMEELVGMLTWGGFGLRAHETRQTPLLRMVTDGASFADAVSIREDIAGGVAPDFQRAGFSRPSAVPLITNGRFDQHLVSPRSAQEYGVETNGAVDWEAPLAISMDPGSLPSDGVLDALGTGLYVGNLWYLNFSDRAACRTTGMTRFGTYWVEGGEIVAPIEVLRFDDTAYHLLGDRLEGLTDTAETILDSSTYFHRSMESVRLPGALVAEMTFTL